MPRFKVGDRIGFDAGADIVYGEVIRVDERAPHYDNLVRVKWDDGFDDEEGNIFAEWEVLSLEEAEDLTP